MESDLRQLIIMKCQARGISVEHLAQVTDCTITELKGYKQGLFMLSIDKLSNLIKTLAISDDELVAAIGKESASRFRATLQHKSAK